MGMLINFDQICACISSCHVGVEKTTRPSFALAFPGDLCSGGTPHKEAHKQEIRAWKLLLRPDKASSCGVQGVVSSGPSLGVCIEILSSAQNSFSQGHKA